VTPVKGSAVRDFTVCLAFRREGRVSPIDVEGAVLHVTAPSRSHAASEAHDQLVYSYGSDDIIPQSVTVVGIFAGHLGFTYPDSEEERDAGTDPR